MDRLDNMKEYFGELMETEALPEDDQDMEIFEPCPGRQGRPLQYFKNKKYPNGNR